MGGCLYLEPPRMSPSSLPLGLCSLSKELHTWVHVITPTGKTVLTQEQSKGNKLMHRQPFYMVNQ